MDLHTDPRYILQELLPNIQLVRLFTVIRIRIVFKISRVNLYKKRIHTYINIDVYIDIYIDTYIDTYIDIQQHKIKCNILHL